MIKKDQIKTNKKIRYFFNVIFMLKY